MKTSHIITIVSLLILLPLVIVIGCAAPAPETVVFPDENLDAIIRSALGKSEEEAITPVELAGLTAVFGAAQLGITDLSGIEHCKNLTELIIHFNQISDISTLSSLRNLNHLHLGGNQISDISPLSSLTNLTYLKLENNQIGDISPLATLNNLIVLKIRFNKISDISSLASLTNLGELDLNNNQISNISPLVGNSGLGKGDQLQLANNNLDLSEGSEDRENIKILEERGVRVDY